MTVMVGRLELGRWA